MKIKGPGWDLWARSWSGCHLETKHGVPFAWGLCRVSPTTHAPSLRTESPCPGSPERSVFSPHIHFSSRFSAFQAAPPRDSATWLPPGAAPVRLPCSCKISSVRKSDVLTARPQRPQISSSHTTACSFVNLFLKILIGYLPTHFLLRCGATRGQ